DMQICAARDPRPALLGHDSVGIHVAQSLEGDHRFLSLCAELAIDIEFGAGAVQQLLQHAHCRSLVSASKIQIVHELSFSSTEVRAKNQLRGMPRRSSPVL